MSHKSRLRPTTVGGLLGLLYVPYWHRRYILSTDVSNVQISQYKNIINDLCFVFAGWNPMNDSTTLAELSP